MQDALTSAHGRAVSGIGITTEYPPRSSPRTRLSLAAMSKDTARI